jgi:hypothetical protein
MSLSLGLKLATALGSGLIKRKAQKGLYEQAKQTKRDLYASNDKYINSLRESMSRLEGMPDSPELDIDTNSIMELVSSARGEVTSAQGRATGEEQMRDSARRTTADTISRARNNATSIMDVLGLTSAAANDETNRMSEIDSQAAQMRSNAINAAKARLAGALGQKAQFMQRKDLAEYEASRDAFEDQRTQINSLMDMEQLIASAIRSGDLGLIAQDGAIANSKAALRTSDADLINQTGGILSESVGELESLIKMLATGGAGGAGGGTVTV